MTRLLLLLVSDFAYVIEASIIVCECWKMTLVRAFNA
jgi:hypothetical protein